MEESEKIEPRVGHISQLAPPTLDYRGLWRRRRVPPCVVALTDLQRLYDELDGKTAEALELHLATLERPVDMDEAEFEDLLEDIREASALTVVVAGAHGEQIVSSSDDPLEARTLPEVVTTVTFDSALALQNFNITPLNRFRLNLDFTEPPSFNTYDPWSQATPNGSQFEVWGDDHTWVTAVFEHTMGFLRRRGRRRGWLHNETVFSLTNWVVGFPAAFWVAFRLDGTLASFLSDVHVALRGALYVYLFLLSLLAFRGVVWGFRWIFPLIELEGRRSGRIRGVAGTVLASLLLALLYDVLKTLVFS